MRSRLVVACAVVFVWACARPPPLPHVPPFHGFDVACAEQEQKSELDPRLEAKLAERDRLYDWRSTVFGTRVGNPPVPTRAAAISDRAGFPTSRTKTIRAYHYRPGLGVGAYAIDRPNGVTTVPFADDGSLAPEVVLPEVTLSPSETSRVLALVHDAEVSFDDLTRSAEKKRRTRLRCGFDPHHVLVFFDANDKPIGKLVLCFECGEIFAFPRAAAFGGREPAAMTAEERAALAAILDTHGLGAWMYGESDELNELRAYEERVYGTNDEPTPRGLERRALRDARPSGVPSAPTPKLASATDRERLCVWLDSEIRRASLEQRPVRGHFECESGKRYGFDNRDVTDGCSATRLCDAPLGQIETCLRATVLKGAKDVCVSDPPPECESLMPCLPYVEWRKSP